MRGAGHEVVVLHFECPVTKQMQQDRLACGKKMAIKIKNKNKKYFQIMVFVNNLVYRWK